MQVSPLAGEWIEILSNYLHGQKMQVSPLAGEWIEILRPLSCYAPMAVSPLAGEWIEIVLSTCVLSLRQCLAPRGRVD